MYVRWNRKKLSAKLNQKGSYTLYAVLVENQRDAEGKPRQRIVSYLGLIREHHIDAIGSRRYFWDKVDSVLSRLIIEESVKEKIRNKLAQKVARLTEDELLQWKEDMKKLWGVM